jgi:hypothetical protein
MVLAVPACAGPAGADRTVFQLQSTQYTEGGHFPVGDIVDVGLAPLHNLTSSSVRIRSVRIVDLPSALRVLRVYAYTNAETPARLAIVEGNLIRACPHLPPYPLSRVVTAPHRDSNWQVLVVFKMLRPGRYDVDRARINYIMNGQKGWQYQNFGMIFINHKLKPGHHLPSTECP